MKIEDQKKFRKNNKSFVGLIENRSVSIVASGHIDEDLGEEIDQSDVVIRLNEYTGGYPFSEEFIKKYGGRSDILFRECNDIKFYHSHDNWPIGYIDLLGKCSIKNVFFFNGNGDANNLVDFLNQSAKSIGSNVVFDFIDNSIFEHLKSLINHDNKFPTTGLTCIAACAMCEPKSLSIFGFDFYHGDIKDNIFIDKKSIKYGAYSTYHDLNREIEVFRDDILNRYNVRIDHKLKNAITHYEQSNR